MDERKKTAPLLEALSSDTYFARAFMTLYFNKPINYFDPHQRVR